MVLSSETANTMVFLSNFNLFGYLLYLRQSKEMEMAWLANVNEHFNKQQQHSCTVPALIRIGVFAVELLYHRHLYMCKR